MSGERSTSANNNSNGTASNWDIFETKEYTRSDLGQQEQAARAKYRRIASKLNDLVGNGQITQDRADSLLSRQEKITDDEIDEIRQNFADSQTIGSFEDQKRYLAWAEKNGQEVPQELKDKLLNIEDWLTHGRIDDKRASYLANEVIEEARKKELATAPAKDEELDAARDEELNLSREEQLAKAREEELELQRQIESVEREAALNQAKIEEVEIQKEQEEILRKQAENDAEIKKLEQELMMLKPLTAINADFSHDERELAEDLAERDLNEETSKAGFVKRLWKKTLFKKYYQRKYVGEYLRHERKTEVDGEELDIHELVKKQSSDAMERFVLGATEDMRFIHEKIGKKRKDGSYDGEKLIPADERTNAEIKAAIEKFAGAKIPEGKTLEDLKREFKNEVHRIQAGAIETGRLEDGSFIDNYLDVAIQARERFEHVGSMEKVMEGFRVYNAEVRDSIRTKAHRDNIDKIVDRYESSKIGQFIPPEIVAGAVSIASGLGQLSTRAILGATGGMLASSVISGLRERNHITEDRARMLRDVASGLSYEGQSEKPKGKMAKYEARIGGTLYDMRSATDLATGIEQALTVEGEARSDALLRAIAEARVRIDLSDSEQKDLISYSSESKRGKERKDLDIATITAERALSDGDKEKIKIMKAQIQKEILDSIDEKDADFKRKRAAMAVKKAGKTLAVGAALFFASQEVVAAIDPNKIGVFEKAGLLQTKNNADASETLLASGFGLNRGANVVQQTTEPVQYRADQQIEIAQAEANGYTGTKISDGWTETHTTITEVDPASSTAAVRVQYDGWGNNGTGYSDGNELRAYLNNGGIVSGMHGVSTTTNGLSLDYDSLAAMDQIRGYITIGGNKFEVVASLNQNGQLTWGENGIFTLANGGTIRGISESGEKLYRYFEIAADTGVDANGVQHIIPFATDVGRDSFAGTITQVAEDIIEHPAVYEFTKTIVTSTPRDIMTAGLAFAPETARTGLGAATRSDAASHTNEGTHTNPDSATYADEGAHDNPTPVTHTGGAPANPAPAPAPSPSGGAPVAPAGEGAPASPEPRPAEPEEEPVENPEAEKFSNEMLEKIKNSADAIGGQESVDILTSDTLRIGPASIDRLYDWWDGLSESEQAAVIDLVKEIYDNDNRDFVKWGRAARTFLTFNAQVMG